MPTESGDATSSRDGSGAAGRVVVSLFVGVILLAGGYFVLGMPGMDHGSAGGKGVRLVLYCRSGRTSATAAQSLLRHGYTNVVDLEGGMTAWRAAGRPLVIQQQ